MSVADPGYIVAANLDTGDPVWTFRPTSTHAGHVLYDGCGSVWSSGTVLPRAWDWWCSLLLTVDFELGAR